MTRQQFCPGDKGKKKVGAELHPRPEDGSKWKLYYSLLETDFKSISCSTAFKDFTLGCLSARAIQTHGKRQSMPQ